MSYHAGATTQVSNVQKALTKVYVSTQQIFILSYRILGVEIPPRVGALPLHDGRRVFLPGDFIDAEVDAAEIHTVDREWCDRREPE